MSRFLCNSEALRICLPVRCGFISCLCCGLFGGVDSEVFNRVFPNGGSRDGGS
jgi:hypothetical protein